jgi:hypothetical protein
MTQSNEPQVQFPPLPVGAVGLILEGLGGLPTARSGELFFFLKHTAETQLQAASADKPAAPSGDIDKA